MKLTHPRVLIWLYSLEPPVLALVSLTLLFFSGWTLFAWVVPGFIFLVLPIMDYRSRDDNFNHRLAAKHLTKHRSFFQWVARSYALPQLLVLALAVFILTEPVSGSGLLAVALTAGIVNGIAIAPAHELNHTTNRLNKLFAAILVAPTGYGHFLVEHNIGHHVKVATPEDPASARYGENVWAFSVRSLVIGFLSAYQFEFRRNCSILSSIMVQSWMITFLFLALCITFAGTQGLIFFLAQAVIGAFLLEAVNYIEHYGLLRQRTENGDYEPCTPQHSWNSNKLVSNIGLFNLQRHSDHHAHASRPYELLRHHPDAPTHPTGYAGMLVIAMVPPIWFRLMNPRVLAHYQGDLSKVNLHPRFR